MAKKQSYKVRRWNRDDIPQIIKCHEAAYPDGAIAKLRHEWRVYRTKAIRANCKPPQG